MSTLVFLIEQLAVGLYILIAAGIFWYWRQWRQARRAYRATTFELERSVARYRIGGALTVMVLLIEFGLMVTGIRGVVAPTVRDDQELVEIVDSFRHQPVDVPFQTPTRAAPLVTLPVDASGNDLGGQQNTTPFSTTTPIPPTPVGTIEANAPAASGCTSPNAILLIPANGMRVFQSLPITGSAYHADFHAYKLELRGPGTADQFVILSESMVPFQQAGILAQFNPAAYEPGPYRFRLMVFDSTTTLQAHCEVTIYISDPLPTPSN